MKARGKFLHSLFEVAHVEFQAYDLHKHKLIFSSGMISKLLGYSDGEYLDLSYDFCKKIVHPDDFPIVLRTMDKIAHAAKGEIIEMTVRARRSDGYYIWLYSRQMIYKANHKNYACSIIREVEDVTRLIELQEELKEKVGQLQLVSHKNSHLLRSPVATIIGLVGLIEESGIIGEHNRQTIHFLKEAVVKLDEVIYEINDIARTN
jgi:PAS domain S-box-containing protein